MPVQEISATPPVGEIGTYERSNTNYPKQESKSENDMQPQAALTQTSSMEAEPEPAMTANEAIGSSVLPPASAPARYEQARGSYENQGDYPKEPMGQEQLPKVDASI
jgi:hypothetical protein